MAKQAKAKKDSGNKEFPMPAIRLTPAPPPPPEDRSWDRIYANYRKPKPSSSRKS